MFLPQTLVTCLFIVSAVAGHDPQTIQTVRTLAEASKTFGGELLQVLHSRDILRDLKEGITDINGCSNKLFSLLSNLDTESYGFLDAAGKPGPGLMDGNFLWLGNYDSCDTIQVANGSNEHYGNCQLKARVVTTYVLTWTACMPQECRTTADVYPLLKQLTTLVAEYTNNTININPDTMQLVCDVEQKYDAGAYVGVVLIALFGALVAIGSIWYLLEPVAISLLNRHQDDLKGLIEREESENEKQIQDAIISNPVQQNHPQSYIGQFVKCFALQRTFETLTNTDSKPGQVLCLNGIRVLSINWVVLGHCYAMMMGNVNDTKYLSELGNRLSFSVIFNALPSVDSFFLMSGFLVCYLLLKQLAKRGNLSPIQWISFYVHRYIRLTVPYLIAILLEGCLYRLMVTGPRAQDMTGAAHTACTDGWWTDILYINNLYPWKAPTGCLAQGWYLANDMQFFFIAPAFIVLIFYKPLIGIINTVGAIGASAIAAAVLAAHYHLGPTIISANQNAFWLTYDKPWTRITPYLIGILGGWFYWSWGEKIKKGIETMPAWLKFMTAIPIWLLTAAIQYGVVFGLFNDLSGVLSGKTPSEVDSVFYQSLARIGWSLSLMIQILICQTGLGGFINSILSWRGWTMLSRLTYSVFLLHVGMITIVGGGARHVFSLRPDFEYAIFYLGILMISYLAAMVLYLVIEQPVANLENIAFRKSN